MLKNRLVILCLKRTYHYQPGSFIRQIFIEYVTYRWLQTQASLFALSLLCTSCLY